MTKKKEAGPFDIVIVGAGISGAVLAERYANVLNKKVLVLEKRDHVGGNCYDFYNSDGIMVSKYGAHLFHTNFDDVWQYVNRFSQWSPYEHRVLSFVDGRFLPIPVNITTVNRLFGLNIKTEEEMKSWLFQNTLKIEFPQNSEEVALSKIGPALYEKMIKNYTKKQWDLWPRELEASVLERIPVRTNFDDRYFGDNYQAQPVGGFAPLFKKILDHPNITVLLNSDYFKLKEKLGGYEKLFFTGPIDRFFNHKFDKLQYRSIRFEFETHDRKFYQENSVINYPNDHDFTRIVEYKHITKQNHPKTTISKEYSTWEGEPFYPVPTQRNQEVYERYRWEAGGMERKGVYFVGRLANYKYFNMDQAFKNSLDLFYQLNPKG